MLSFIEQKKKDQIVGYKIYISRTNLIVSRVEHVKVFSITSVSSLLWLTNIHLCLGFDSTFVTSNSTWSSVCCTGINVKYAFCWHREFIASLHPLIAAVVSVYSCPDAHQHSTCSLWSLILRLEFLFACETWFIYSYMSISVETFLPSHQQIERYLALLWAPYNMLATLLNIKTVWISWHLSFN